MRINKLISANKLHPNIFKLALLLVALAIMTIGVVQLANRYSATSGIAPLPNVQTTITKDIPKPDESKPVVDDYQVPADQPRSITLASINTGGIIQKIGLTKENAIAVPSNIHFAGWYTGSSKPGEIGLSIIDGHVSGKYNDGIFKNLRDLRPADKFQVEYGDKSIREFEVIEVKKLPEQDSADYLLTKRLDIESQLNLITCGGTFNESTQKFDDRVIVVSTAIN